MRFRKRWLAKINIAFTNRITSVFGAGVRIQIHDEICFCSRNAAPFAKCLRA
jgi:hypothetical protein